MTNLTDSELAKLQWTDGTEEDASAVRELCNKWAWEQQCKNAESTMKKEDGMVVRVSKG